MRWFCLLAAVLLGGCPLQNALQATGDAQDDTQLEATESPAPAESEPLGTDTEQETEAPKEPVQRPQLDGSWQMLLEGWPFVCFSVEDDAIASWDQGCSIPARLAAIDSALAIEIEDLTTYYHNLWTQRHQDLVNRGLTGSSIEESLEASIARDRDRDIAAARQRAASDRIAVQASAPLVVCKPFVYDGAVLIWSFSLVPREYGVAVAHEMQLTLDGGVWSGTLDDLPVTLRPGTAEVN